MRANDRAEGGGEWVDEMHILTRPTRRRIIGNREIKLGEGPPWATSEKHSSDLLASSDSAVNQTSAPRLRGTSDRVGSVVRKP